jgi:hypothetical protein
MHETETHSVDVRPWVGGNQSIVVRFYKHPSPVFRETHTQRGTENEIEPLVG